MTHNKLRCNKCIVEPRVPTAPGKPGKMMKGFPVMEIWNFEILQISWKNDKKPGKMRISV